MNKREKLIANIEAIKVALQENKITEEDKIILKQYTGFGELKCILLNPEKPEQFSESEKNLIPLVKELQNVIQSKSRSNEEFKQYLESLKRSVMTSFYTPPELIQELNSGFADMNLSFDKILEPSAGMGVFFRIQGNSYTAIEKDILTGKILKALNPDKDVHICGFEEMPHSIKGTFNLVSSNIPFGDFKVFDADLLSKPNTERARACNTIHTYFFEKGLDTLKEGGILAFITSTGVMDSRKNEEFRHYLMTKADLITAIRLPQKTFADTKVQSDLIVLQKNSSKTQLHKREKDFIISSKLDNVENYSNTYYKNYENIIQTNSYIGTNLYGKPSMIYEHNGGINGIAKDVRNIISSDFKRINIDLFKGQNQLQQTNSAQLSLFDEFFSFVEDTQGKEEKKEIEVAEFTFDNPIFDRIGSFQLHKNLVGIAVNNTTAKVLNYDSEHLDLIRKYIEVRDSYFSLKNYEKEHFVESPQFRKNLNEKYDSFVNSFGFVTDNVRFFKDDAAIAEIRSLELIVEGEIQKADIFREAVAFAKQKEIYSPEEALSLSLNNFNQVDLSYISKLTQLYENDVIEKLEGKILLNPETYMFEEANVFLSGNVGKKLDNAKYIFSKDDSNRQLALSIKRLEMVIPTMIPFEDIGISLGERWIPCEIFSEFASSIFDEKVSVVYNMTMDEFGITARYSFQAHEKYSVLSTNRRYSATDVLRYAMIDNMPEMTKKIQVGDGTSTVPDTEAIQSMNNKIMLLQTEFKQWLNSMSEEKKRLLETVYNSKFNCYVKPQYDGTFQTFPDLDKDSLGIQDLYSSQKDAILLLKNNGGGIIDHEVGGGKTLIQCVAAYEMKRLGMANKPMIIGLKTNLVQIADTFKKAYPDAKILYANKEDFTKEKRTDFFNKIQNNNWDCIIMTHEQFKAIPQSLDIQRGIISEEVDKIEDAIRNYNEDESSNYKQLEKSLIKRKENLQYKLSVITSSINKTKDQVVDFNTMGIDHIFVDESHKFKNLMFQTRHQRVAGLGNSNGSERSLNLLFAIRTIQQKTGKDLGATFLSGTTISNSLTELYNIFNYLRPNAMKEQGIFSFDAWASIYTLKSKDYEFNVTNDIVQKERFREFVKVPELAAFYAQITDYKTAEDIGVDRPQKNEIFMALEQTNQQRDMFTRLKDFAKTGDGTIIYREPLSDSEQKAKMLIATNTAKKAALDMRLINNTMFSDEPNNKVNVVVNKIYEYYMKYNTHKGTQFVFSDLGTYKPGNNFNIYSDLKQKLIEKGIPAKEIQFIQTATTDKKRAELFDKMNDGSCRIIVGSTEMLGTGVNAQKRCVAIHHFDIPWTPKDLEQRNGRGVRKGNDIAKLYANNKVDVIVYGTKQTLDTYKFNLLKNKALFISQIKKNNIAVRTIDEGGLDKDSGMNFSEYLAVLSGNTDLLERAKLEKIVIQLKSEENTFLKQLRNRDLKINNFSKEIANNQRIISLFNLDLKEFQSFPKNSNGDIISPNYKIGNRILNDEKQIGETINKILDTPNDNMGYLKIGNIANFELLMKAEILFTNDGIEQHSNKLYVSGHLKYSYNSGHVARSPKLAADYAINALKRIEGLIQSYQQKNLEIREKIKTLKKIDLKFLSKDKLNQTTQKLAEITEKINNSLMSKQENIMQNTMEEKGYKR